MPDTLDKVVRYVVNGLEECMDQHEDRMIIGGPDWDGEPVSQGHSYKIWLDGECFRVTIRRSE